MINHIPFGSSVHGRKVELGDIVHLQRQEKEVVACEKTGVLMLNIDANELAQGDLAFIKKLGLTISNPDTDAPVAIGVDYNPDTFGESVAAYLGGSSFATDEDEDEEEDDEDDHDHDDDSFLFGSVAGALAGSLAGDFLGSSSFGGFGGGSFNGGGASSSW